MLYPFYETVVNSIQAIDERKNCSDGEISVYIERDKSEQTLFEEYSQYLIASIRIVDNGIGITSANYENLGKLILLKKHI